MKTSQQLGRFEARITIFSREMKINKWYWFIMMKFVVSCDKHCLRERYIYPCSERFMRFLGYHDPVSIDVLTHALETPFLKSLDVRIVMDEIFIKKFLTEHNSKHLR